MGKPVTFTFRTDSGVVAYTANERPVGGDAGFVAGGLLGGDEHLVEWVTFMLTERQVSKVRVVEPNVDFVFTESRDTPADVAAAFLAVGGGRGELSPAGWDVLLDALPVAARAPRDDAVVY
ncbi:hypothetical protein B7435_23905 [Mycolicibacterium peregrinum]|uniref:Uncharacterized protein n=1 Tax=Mycolicibacterium alvei TaxID=67081 RepID=A0A6N4V229_9MYCO|nr:MULTISPECIES: hypothetical protein [Mycolicibacterium]MCV7003436.1 hypothetical protein [Mycolicibacterium alvei]OBG15009.1 hypothetical protein A5768_08225 [Mycolicibacterium fortuitum]OWL98804.1 hypothetical protein B7435_23905 [Mycolicibacterium peregrinum]BBX30618.1 hypothetical protein MALV_57430 [Mycolicibacterium alvei]